MIEVEYEDEFKYLTCGTFVGVVVDDGEMLQVWKDVCGDSDEDFYIDFNNPISFKMALDNYTGICLRFIDQNRFSEVDYPESPEYSNGIEAYEEFVKREFEDHESRRYYFNSITANFMEAVTECPGCIHASFTADENNILITLDGT